MIDLSRPCDACGRMVGGGVEYCPKCQIYLCFICCHHLRNQQKEITIRIDCPRCEHPSPEASKAISQFKNEK